MQQEDCIDLTQSDDEDAGGAAPMDAAVNTEEEEEEEVQPVGDYFFDPDAGHGVSARDLDHSIGPAWECYTSNHRDVTCLGFDPESLWRLALYSREQVPPARQELVGKMPSESWYKLPHYEEGTLEAEDYHALISAFKSKVSDRLEFKELSQRYYGWNGKPVPSDKRKRELLAVYNQRKNVFDRAMLRFYEKLKQRGYDLGGYSASDAARIKQVTDDLKGVFVHACSARGLMCRAEARLFYDLKELSFDAREVRATLKQQSASPADYADKRERLEKFLQQFIDAHHSIFSLHASFEEQMATLKKDIRSGLLQEDEPAPALTDEQEKGLREVLAEVFAGKRR
ncbi:hypothetical protein JKP88DRAFT_243945 [Tribonema minus]|uniref:Uncharacterized protein n=1 Tax=Tribonema minus TaxID=303371 RepID=A0A836CI52_9STRA|nr:hypothetical protein JKP88DRAFT_243945 [Tribonema minus]